jgi:hypothetical protein
MSEITKLRKIFTDEEIIKKVKNKLPKLFAIAELESSRAGKIGMEVGSVREQILVALLVSVFGEKNVETNIPITEYEKDVEVSGEPISIKTITGNGGIKVVWTVDAQKAIQFFKSYKPTCDILLAVISWDNNPKVKSGLFLIPQFVQERTLNKFGRNKYLKLPKEGTNPRGVEISRSAISEMLNDKDVYHINIVWKKENIQYKTYKRWLDMWNEN